MRALSFAGKTVFKVLIALLLSYQTVVAGTDFKVTVSIKPVHSIVSGLMKDIGVPELLIKDHQTPYTYHPSSDQIKQLSSMNLVFWVGPELENTLQPTLNELPDSVKVIEILSSSKLKILPSRQNSELRDPFFWMDDRNMIILVDEIAKLLIKMDPTRSHVYTRNRREMLDPLRRIDKEYEYGYRGLKAGLGVLYFDTLQYFEQAYALKTLGRVTGSPWDKESTINLLKIRNRVTSHEAACLFLDKSMPAKNLKLLIQNQQNTINTGELDILGLNFEAGPDLYLNMMEYNTDVIKKCLNADMEEAAKARLSAAKGKALMTDGLGGRFILKDHLGQTVTEKEMMGHYSIIFFGYTSCPDICPTNLMVLTQAIKRLGKLADKITPYFITVDPSRDTVKVLNKYVQYFDSRLVGLTGSKTMIKRVADQFKARFEKGEVDPANPNMYAMDHTASLYLMAPNGSFITKFAHGISPDVLASELSDIIR